MIITTKSRARFRVASMPVEKPIFLDLLDQSLWIGDIKNGFDIEEKYSTTVGSYSFLWDDNNTLLFDKRDLMFDSLLYLFPQKVINDINLDLNSKSINSIELITSQNFNDKSYQCLSYDQEKDNLIFFYDIDEVKNESVDTISLVKDFDFIVNNNAIVGSILYNSTCYLDQQNINNIHDIKGILFECIQLLDDEAIDKMDNGDINLKQKLFHIKEKAGKDNIFSKFACNFLNEYY